MSFKELRQKMGLTQRQVADIYGIPYSTIQKWEHGINNPPKYVLTMMMELYQLRDVAEVIGGKNDSTLSF
jgi:DNA-binding transcriptional regulator YiaG